MKLRLDEYYYIISDEFDEIEDYMPPVYGRRIR